MKHILPITALGALAIAMSPGSLSAQDSRLRISGYGNGHYMDHKGTPREVNTRDLDDGFFQLREFSLFLDYAVSDTMVISTEIEAADNGNRYTANYAYFDYEVTQGLKLRAGKILVPFLSYNENKPNYRQFLMSQPFTAMQLAPVNGTPLVPHAFGWSDAGVLLDWTKEVGDLGVFNAKVSVINGIGSTTDILDDNSIQLDAGMMTPIVRPRDGLIQNRTDNNVSDNNNDIASTVKLTYADGTLPLEFGLSLYTGAWDPNGTQDLNMYGVHLNYLERDWTLKGEWALARVDQQAGTLLPAQAGFAGNTSTGDYQMRAWYLEGSWVAWRWEGADESERYLRLVARYDDVDTNNKVRFTPWDRSRLTIGTEWQFSGNSRFRLEWQRNNVHSYYNAPVGFVNAGGKNHIDMFMASVIFWF